jgi:hypothetical protein
LDLKRLCEVSKQLHEATLSSLYESITLSTDELLMTNLVFTAEKIPSKHLKYTKDIRIKTSFYKRLNNRCLYHNYSSLSDETAMLSFDEEMDDDKVSVEAVTSYLSKSLRR